MLAALAGQPGICTTWAEPAPRSISPGTNAGAWTRGRAAKLADCPDLDAWTGGGWGPDSRADRRGRCGLSTGLRVVGHRGYDPTWVKPDRTLCSGALGMNVR